jgi:hypothetical protein
MITAVKLNQKGQALIELVIFLPIMFTLYSMISGFANAINGSINQQKITRSYFFYRAQNSSFLMKPGAVQSGWTQFGFSIAGWADQVQGDAPFMPCYRITVPLANSNGDSCDASYSNEKTQFIRVATVFGVCGGTYGNNSGTLFIFPDLDGSPFETVTDDNSCTIR